MAYVDEESKKRKTIQNYIAPGSRDVMYIREICKGKSFKDAFEIIRKKSFASNSMVNKAVHSALVQLFADLVAD